MNSRSDVCEIIINDVRCKNVCESVILNPECQTQHSWKYGFICGEHRSIYNCDLMFLSNDKYDSINKYAKSIIQSRCDGTIYNNSNAIDRKFIKFYLNMRDKKIEEVKNQLEKSEIKNEETAKQLEKVETMVLYLSRQIDELKEQNKCLAARIYELGG